MALPPSAVAARRSPCGLGARCHCTLPLLVVGVGDVFGQWPCHFGSLVLAARLVIMVRAATARCHFWLTFWLVALVICLATSSSTPAPRLAPAFARQSLPRAIDSGFY